MQSNNSSVNSSNSSINSNNSTSHSNGSDPIHGGGKRMTSFNSITLCGPSRSKCGYCQGSRINILSIPNPPITYLPQAQSQQQQQQQQQNDDSNSMEQSSQSQGVSTKNVYNKSSPSSSQHPQKQQEQEAQCQSSPPPQPLVLKTELSSNNTINDHKMNISDDEETKHKQQSNPNPNSTNSEKEHEEIITSSTSTKAYSILASTFDPHDYQNLLDKGWRRSGDLLYYPKNWESCCPSHPIRLDVNKFRVGKSQKKVLKNLQCALNAGVAGVAGVNVSKGSNIHCSGKSHASGESNISEKATKRLKRPFEKQHQHPHQQHSQTIKKPTLNEIHKHSKEVIVKSGLLCILQNQIIQIVHNYHDQKKKKPSIIDLDSNHHLSTKVNNLIKKCSSLKITKIDKPRDIRSSGSSTSMCSSNNPTTTQSSVLSTTWKYNIRISLSTSICAALHGSTNGQIDKSTLGKCIIHHLQSYLGNGTATTNEEKANLSDHGIDIESISFHEKSGHVNVSILLSSISIVATTTVFTKSNNNNQDNDEAKEKETNNAVLNDNKMDMGGEFTATSTMKKSKMENAITDFIRSLSSSSSNHNNNNHYHHRHENILKSIQPPYKLTIRSIPSRISGRDPKVHRLYTKYQTAVHNDTDPFIRNQKEEGDNNGHQYYDDVKMSYETESEHDDDVVDVEDLNGHDQDYDDNNDVYSDGGDHHDCRQPIEKLRAEDFDRLYGRGYDQAQRKKIYKRYVF